MRRAITLLTIALFLLLASAPAHADNGRTSALSWVRLPGAEKCIAATTLAAAVEKRLGRRVFVPPADAEVSVEASVAYRADTKTYKATFRVADRAGNMLGQREVEERADSCDKLDDRFAFVLSLLIDPDGALAPTPEPAPPPTAAPEPVLVAPAPIAPPPPPPPREPWRWMANVELGGATGLVPDVGWTVAAGGILTPPHWPGLHARGASFLPTSQRLEGGALAEIGFVMGQLGVCPLQLHYAPFGITACIDGFLGRLHGEGSGFADAQTFDALVGGLAIDVVGELAVGRWLLFTLSPSILVPLSRASLTYDDAQGDRRTIFEVSSVSGSLALGIGIGAR